MVEPFVNPALNRAIVVLQVDLISRADARRIQAFVKALNPASQILLTRNSEVHILYWSCCCLALHICKYQSLPGPH